jgi:hypothetical protein
MDKHVKHVQEVLKRLQSARLQIDLKKSEFFTKQTRYLGLIITLDGIEIDPKKVYTISL